MKKLIRNKTKQNKENKENKTNPSGITQNLKKDHSLPNTIKLIYKYSKCEDNGLNLIAEYFEQSFHLMMEA